MKYVLILLFILISCLKSSSQGIAGKGFTENPGIAMCVGDTICSEVKRLLQIVSNGTYVSLGEIKVGDQDGHTQNCKPLQIRITE